MFKQFMVAGNLTSLLWRDVNSLIGVICHEDVTLLVPHFLTYSVHFDANFMPQNFIMFVEANKFFQ